MSSSRRQSEAEGSEHPTAGAWSTRARSGGGDRGAEGCTGEVVRRKMLPFLMSLRFCKEKKSW